MLTVQRCKDMRLVQAHLDHLATLETYRLQMHRVGMAVVVEASNRNELQARTVAVELQARTAAAVAAGMQNTLQACTRVAM